MLTYLCIITDSVIQIPQNNLHCKVQFPSNVEIKEKHKRQIACLRFTGIGMTSPYVRSEYIAVNLNYHKDHTQNNKSGYHVVQI